MEWTNNKTDERLMKLIGEHINEAFKEESDPIKDMDIGSNLAMFKDLEKRGVRFWFGWGDGEGERERLKTIENIEEITNLIDKLEYVGFDVTKMSMSRATSIYVSVVQVLKSNCVLFGCATEEDADLIITMLKKLTIWQYDIFKKSTGEELVPIRTGGHKWLDDLINNRENYKKLL